MKRFTDFSPVTPRAPGGPLQDPVRRDLLGWSLAAAIAAGSGVPTMAAATQTSAASRSESEDHPPPWPADVRHYGAVGDGLTDDTQAIIIAVNEAAHGQGTAETRGLVVFPSGTFLVSRSLVIPNKVKLLGQGSRSTIIRAAPTFPADSAVVRLGTDSNVFDCSLDRLQIDCAGRLGSIGVYSGYANEQCGVYNCVIRDFRDYGVRFDTLIGASAVEVYRTEIHGSKAGFNGGIFCSQTSCMLSVHDVTIAGSLHRTPGSFGINMESGHLIVRTLHCETVNTGIALGENASCVIQGLSGHPSIDDLVYLSPASNGNITIMGVRQNGGKVGIRDERTGRTISSPGQIGLYAMGSGSGSAGGGDKFVITDVIGPDGWWNVRTAVGQAAVDLFPDTDSSPSVGAGNVFRTKNSQPTTITNLRDGRQGQRVRILFGDGHTTLQGPRFLLQGTFRGIPGATIEFVCNGDTWVELNRALSRESFDYATEGFVATRALNSERLALTDVASVLATLIDDLKSRGILQ